MKKIVMMFALLAVMALAGCTQNNGHIGHWFGQWKVERVTIDGVDNSDYRGDVFFCFQGGVFGVRTASGGMYYGIWRETNTDDVIDITMNTEVDQSQLPSYDNLHIYVEKAMTFRLLSHKGSNKVLEYVRPDDGHTYTYYLKKW